MKKALVTGGAGFIGSNLVDELIARGVEVDVIDDLSTGKLENVNPKANLICNKIETIQPGDLPGDYEVVFHLAARARIQLSIEKPFDCAMANEMGTVAALEIARRSNAHLVFSSSSSVYGANTMEALHEDAILNPLNPYALTKALGEEWCKLYTDLYGIKTTRLRYFNVFGERQSPDGPYALVVARFMAQHAAGEPFTIVGDGEQRRDFTYVKDVVAANLLVADKGATGAFNAGTGHNTSVNEIADAIDPAHPKIEADPRRGEVRYTLADNTKLRGLGWRPSMSVVEWITSKPI